MASLAQLDLWLSKVQELRQEALVRGDWEEAQRLGAAEERLQREIKRREQASGWRPWRWDGWKPAVDMWAPRRYCRRMLVRIDAKTHRMLLDALEQYVTNLDEHVEDQGEDATAVEVENLAAAQALTDVLLAPILALAESR